MSKSSYFCGPGTQKKKDFLSRENILENVFGPNQDFLESRELVLVRGDFYFIR